MEISRENRSDNKCKIKIAIIDFFHDLKVSFLDLLVDFCKIKY